MNEYILPQNDSAKQSNLAPSEKHLEDWIVQNFDNFNDQLGYGFHRLIGRQLRFPSGIADLVIAGTCCIWIVELKKNKIDGAAVSQLSHYINDGLTMHRYINADTYEPNNIHSHSEHIEDRIGTPSFRGILIGSGFDKLAEKAASGMNIEMYQYSYENGDYLFDGEVANHYYGINERLFDPDVISGIKEVMRHLHMFETDRDALNDLYRQEGWIK